MQNVISTEQGHPTRYLKNDDPLYPCDAVKEDQKITCYLMQSSRMLDMNERNFSKVFELCSTVEEPYTDICYQSLGRDASGQTLSEPHATLAICSLGKDERAYYNCAIGAMHDYIGYFHSNSQAKELCLQLPTNLSNTCIAELATASTSIE